VGVAGVDLGANTEHSESRLYFFFGDVATSRGSHNLLNTDLVTGPTTERYCGMAAISPRAGSSSCPRGRRPATGQPDWRFCGKCHGLFFAPQGNSAGTVCPNDGAPHSPHGPVVGVGLPGLVAACGGLLGWRRRKAA
jgi:hypothetical protein